MMSARNSAALPGAAHSHEGRIKMRIEAADRDEVTRILHQHAHAIVFEQAPWPASRETRDALWQMMIDAELVSIDPDTRYIHRLVPGFNAEYDLLLYVIGLGDPYDFFFEHADEEQKQDMADVPNEVVFALTKRMLFNAYGRRFLRSRSRQ
jgi:hypothetical protein